MSAGDAWTRPYCGITHLGGLRDERRVTVDDCGDFALLSRYVRGHGRLSQTTHASVEEAKQVGERWIAGLIDRREARPGAASAPLCPARPEHGPTVRRPQAGQTPEQRFCGDGWDCPVSDCRGAVRFPSPERLAQLEARRATSKQPEEN